MRYDDLVADPVGTVEAIYGYFGLPLAGAAADAIRVAGRVVGDGAARGREPRTATRSVSSAWTGEEVDERFAAYAETAGG